MSVVTGCQHRRDEQTLIHDRKTSTQVRKIYYKLQRNERNRVGAAVAAAAAAAPGSPMSASQKVYGPSPADGSPSSSGRRPPPSFVPVGANASSDAVTAAALEGGAHSIGPSITPIEFLVQQGLMTANQEGGIPRRSLGGGGAAVTAGENGGSIRIAADDGALTKDKGGISGKDRSGCVISARVQAGGVETVWQVGERLQEAVRLCSVGAGCGEGGAAPGALTLSERELSRPKQLLKSLKLFSARSGGGGGAAGGEKGSSADESCGTKGRQKSGFLTQALSEGDARRTAEQPLGNPLMETAWLAARFPKVTLADLLVNRLELSLWASYWKWGKAAALGTTR